jgi:hydrogenase maturation protease
MPGKYKTLILGVGNDILMDDGIGPRLVNDLSRELQIPGAEFKSACVGGLELVESIQGFQRLIIIDAIKTDNGIPGAVYYFNQDTYSETLHLSNLHDISFLQALKLAEILGMMVPEAIHIIAIEIKEDKIFGSEFTPELQAKYHEIKSKIQTFLDSLTTNEIVKQ